jgi:hypothetical protein
MEMANRADKQNIDFMSGAAVNGTGRNEREDDAVSEDALDRLEQITGGAEQPRAYRGEMAREAEKLQAETEEQLDALRVNLNQDGNRMNDTRHGTGIIADDVARDQIARATEVGPELEDMGVNAVVPGRENTSGRLRRRHPDTGIARAGNVVEGNVEEPREEGTTDRRVDEGTAA